MRIEIDLPASLCAYLKVVAEEDGDTVGGVLLEMASHFVDAEECALYMADDGQEDEWARLLGDDDAAGGTVH
jgi:hypothetical protein